MDVDVFVKCKWDRRLSGFDQALRLVTNTFKQAIIASIYSENLHYQQADIARRIAVDSPTGNRNFSSRGGRTVMFK